jgi:hypothetical protein
LFGQLKLLKMDMESFVSPTTASDAFLGCLNCDQLAINTIQPMRESMRTATTAKDFGASNQLQLLTPVGCQLVRYSLQGTEW